MPELENRVYQDNLEKLRERQPDLAMFLEAQSTEGLEFCRNQKGELNLCYHLEDGGSLFVHSEKDIEQEVDQWFANLNLESQEVLYVYGIGLGYSYRPIQKWLNAKAGRFAIYLEDNPKVFKRFLQTGKAAEVLKDLRVQVHYFVDYEESSALFKWLSSFFMSLSLQVSALPSYEQMYSEKYGALKHEIESDRDILYHQGREMTSLGSMVLRNFFSNAFSLPFAKPLAHLKKRFESMPAVICGAGPSLNRNIDVLKTLKQKALIFAGASSINVLNAHGMNPHFAGGIDPNQIMFDLLIKTSIFEVPFIFTSRIQDFAHFVTHGTQLYSQGMEGYPVVSWLEEELGMDAEEALFGGYNVVNFLTSIALYLSCDPIIFVGMDLSFTEMRLHADGVRKDSRMSEKRILENPTGVDGVAFKKEDIFGNPVYTLWKWLRESKWTSSTAENFPDTTFLNATEGGIGFSGIENLSLREVSEKYLHKSYDLTGRVHAELQSICMPEQVTEANIEDALRELKTSLESCVSLCEQIQEEMRCVRDLAGKGDADEMGAHAGRADLFEVELHSELAFEKILQSFAQASAWNAEREYLNVFFDPSLATELDKHLKRFEIKEKQFEFIKEASQSVLKALGKFLD